MVVELLKYSCVSLDSTPGSLHFEEGATSPANRVRKTLMPELMLLLVEELPFSFC